MANAATKSPASGLRRPPQITLALDEEKRVLYLNREQAGTGFAGLTDESTGPLHQLIHPGCDGKCRFNGLLNRAWKSLTTRRESVEWEIEDPVLNAHFRLNISRPPTSKNVSVERRRRFALLTVTDITEIRREYEAVLSSNRELQRKIDLIEGKVTGAVAGDPANDAGTRRVGEGILAAQERERQRIAADLHDGVAQTMGVIKFSVESRVAKLKSRYPDLDFSDLEPIVDQICEAIDDLRKISRNLSPALLSEFGICAAIDMLCNEFGSELPRVEVACAACVNEVTLPEAVKVATFRIVQEALNNIGKHASPRNVRVALAADAEGLVLEIQNDGAGFDPELLDRSADSGKGQGLDSMRERAELTGGNFELRSSNDVGTTVRVVWPEEAIDLLRDKPVLDRK